jgi:penicillin-binding protein 1C
MRAGWPGKSIAARSRSSACSAVCRRSGGQLLAVWCSQRRLFCERVIGPRAAWAVNDTAPPTFEGYAPDDTAKLRIDGIAEGSRRRPVPGAQQVVVNVRAQGVVSRVWWMLDGKVQNNLDPRLSYTVSLSRSGKYTLTVMDRQGRFDRVDFEICGIAP